MNDDITIKAEADGITYIITADGLEIKKNGLSIFVSTETSEKLRKMLESNITREHHRFMASAYDRINKSIGGEI